MNEKYLDKNIYNKAKKIADDKYKKHSAYKSAFIVKTYKDLGGRIDESKSKGGLKRWVNEGWKNLTPFAEGVSNKTKYACGEKAPKQKLPSVCRPLKDINKYNKEQIKKATLLKKQGKTINWSKL